MFLPVLRPQYGWTLSLLLQRAALGLESVLRLLGIGAVMIFITSRTCPLSSLLFLLIILRNFLILDPLHTVLLGIDVWIKCLLLLGCELGQG